MGYLLVLLLAGGPLPVCVHMKLKRITPAVSIQSQQQSPSLGEIDLPLFLISASVICRRTQEDLRRLPQQLAEDFRGTREAPTADHQRRQRTNLRAASKKTNAHLSDAQERSLW